MTMPEIPLTPEAKLALNMISMNTAINDLQEDMKTMNKVVLLGNGEISLREQVRLSNRFIDGIRKVAWIAFGAIIVQTIAFAGAVIVAYVRFLPLLESLAANRPTP